MTLRRIYDALTKSKLLKEIYERTGDMNLESKKIFETAMDCLLSNKYELAKEIADEDKKINKYEIKIREDILTYSNKLLKRGGKSLLSRISLLYWSLSIMDKFV